MRSFVKFIRPQRGNPVGIGTAVEVGDRDIAKLDIPSSADFFYFYEASINPKDGHMNQSPVYIVAQDLLTREEAKLLLIPDPAMHRQIVWDKRLSQHDLFALTRSGNLEPVGKSNIVINAEKQQLYPVTMPQPAAPDIQMTLKSPVVAPPAATFRSRKPHI